jgi:hypothetical protein
VQVLNFPDSGTPGSLKRSVAARYATLHPDDRSDDAKVAKNNHTTMIYTSFLIFLP